MPLWVTGDVETWQLPIWLALWPKLAKTALQYRVDRMPTALINARTPVWPEAAPRHGLKFPVSRHCLRLAADGPLLPVDEPLLLDQVESAITGIEQCVGSMEDHVQGDIALAFRQYLLRSMMTKRPPCQSIHIRLIHWNQSHSLEQVLLFNA